MAQQLPAQHFYVNLGREMQEMLNQRKDNYGESGEGKPPPTIYKVPDNVRDEEPKAYKPKLISIGPIHHTKELEDLKWRYLRSLIDRSQRASVEMYVDAIGKVEQSARSQYSFNIGISETEFVKMLVLDGCFIIEFLIKRAVGNVGPPWSEANWNLLMLRNDLLLLENQIPFFVLEILFHESFPNGLKIKEIPMSLLDFALHYLKKGKEIMIEDLEELQKISKKKKEQQHFVEDEFKKFHHLLHLNYICELKNFKGEDVIADSSKGAFGKLRTTITNPIVIAFYFLVTLVLMCENPCRRSSKNDGDKAPRSLPSAKNLIESGIKFKNKKQECYLNVSFIEEDGILEIPFLPIQQTTTSLFRNLIAFEQCCPDVEKYFIAYTVFMDKIIDTPEDVAILVKHGIIESKFGTDEDVARLFNNICKGASLDYNQHYLVKLFIKVNSYCRTARHRWRAALVHGYFHNPWVVISFLAAIALLLLTLGGTVASIEQTVYAVKGYEKQYDHAPPPPQG